jgi:cell division protein FtsW
MNRFSLLLTFVAVVLLTVGIIMVFDTTSAEALDRTLDANTHVALIKQIFYGVFGLILAFFVWSFGYQNILRITPFLLFVVCIMLMLVFVPGIGHTINGAHRWINLFGFSIQPSEIAKYLIPLYLVNQVTSAEKELDLAAFIKILCILSIPLGLILLEPDNGTVAIILVTLAILFFLMKIKLQYWALPLLVLVMIGGVIAYQMPHVRARITIYFNPQADLKGKGHQPYQAKIAAGSGGVFGKGLAESLQKLNYLPEARSDYIAAIFAEEFGFAGIFCLIAAYLLMAYLGFQVALSASDKIGFYTAFTMIFLIVFQAFLNLGVVSGLLPSKGITLPFVSQGGSSLLVNILAFSVLINVARRPIWKKN